MLTVRPRRSTLSILLTLLTGAVLACHSAGSRPVANEPSSSSEAATDLESMRATMSKIRTVGTAFLARYFDTLEANPADSPSIFAEIISDAPAHHGLPLLSEEQSRSMLVPKYLPRLDLIDGWGNPMEVRATARFLSGQDIPDSERGFAVISAGGDGKFHRGPIAVGCFHPEKQPNSDIAWTDGRFVSRPAMSLDENCSSVTRHVRLR